MAKILVDNKNGAFSAIILSLFLVACDSSNDIPVMTVSSNEVVNEQQLETLQARKSVMENKDEIYYFGFDLRASPQEDAAQYLPLLAYLNQKTGYQFRLHFSPKNSSAAKQLGENITQFAAVGASSFLYAQSRYDVMSLVRGLNQLGKAEYQSVFVTKPESKISSIKDFPGKKLALGNRDSTQGHLIPRIMLNEHGVILSDLEKYTYTGSHQNCAEAVISGKYDVCGMQDALAKSLAERGVVKIIYTSRYFPSSGIVSNKAVPEAVCKAVKNALLDFDPQGRDKHTLFHWDKTEMPKGFTDSHDDYKDLREWSIRLGFLLPADKGEDDQQ
ncbi:MAG: phosphate/phosphite/phosphonate ABC transporter substrate-binding protein [Pseudomonadales bacterium]|nr:phosphate/phosphite/phosphonate ABC transporter substrate-binding protein [Pseudomonadales bacterium]